MLTLFVLEGFWLWGLVAFWALGLGVCVYNDRHDLATLDVVVLVALLAVTGNLHLGNVWEYCRHNPLMVVAGILGYFGAGVVWARLKWSLMTSRLKEKVDAWKASIQEGNERRQREYEIALSNHKNSPGDFGEPIEPKPKTILDSSLASDLIGKVAVSGEGRISIRFDHFKGRIMGWVGHWPVSILIWLVGDFLHDVLEQIVSAIRSHFVRAANLKLND